MDMSNVGLGLRIAKKFVGFSAGAVEAQSTIGQGSPFTTPLPLGVPNTMKFSSATQGRTDARCLTGDRHLYEIAHNVQVCLDLNGTGGP